MKNFIKKLFCLPLILSMFVSSLAPAATGWKVDSYGNILGARSTVLVPNGTVSNCRISISGSTFSIVGADGNALSATNPCIVAVQNSTGVTVAASFSVAVSFTFGSASDTDGNLFGIIDANWSSAMPFFLGVIYNDTTPFFVISRLPFNASGAAAASLCQKTDTDCDAQTDVMMLTTGQTLASWVSKPITQVAWIQATYATTGAAWTFATTAKTGFNFNYEAITWTFVAGQMGAASGSFFSVSGGTAPTYTLNSLYTYSLTRYGMVNVYLAFDNAAGGTAGAGTGDLVASLPYIASLATGSNSIGSGEANNNTAGVQGIFYVESAVASATFRYMTSLGTTIATLQGVGQNNAARNFVCSLVYPAM